MCVIFYLCVRSTFEFLRAINKTIRYRRADSIETFERSRVQFLNQNGTHAVRHMCVCACTCVYTTHTVVSKMKLAQVIKRGMFNCRKLFRCCRSLSSPTFYPPLLAPCLLDFPRCVQVRGLKRQHTPCCAHTATPPFPSTYVVLIDMLSCSSEREICRLPLPHSVDHPRYFDIRVLMFVCIYIKIPTNTIKCLQLT